jgi:hypothetical protein
VGEPPIEAADQEEWDEEEEEGEGERPRELVWLLDLPGQVTPKWHPQLVLCEPDIEDEAELRFVHTHGAGLFEVGVRVDDSRGKRGWSDTPFGRVAWIPI